MQVASKLLLLINSESREISLKQINFDEDAFNEASECLAICRCENALLPAITSCNLKNCQKLLTRDGEVKEFFEGRLKLYICEVCSWVYSEIKFTRESIIVEYRLVLT